MNKIDIKHNAQNIISWVLLALLSLVLVVLTYLLFIESNPPLEIYNAPLPISAEIANPGDTVIMVNKFCKFTQANSEMFAFWQRESDGLIWQQQRITLSMGNTECKSLSVPLHIPNDMPEGMWKRVNIAQYQVNILANHSVSWESEYIQIIIPEKEE